MITIGTSCSFLVIISHTKVLAPSIKGWPVPRLCTILHKHVRGHHIRRVQWMHASIVVSLMHASLAFEECSILVHKKIIPLFLSNRSLVLLKHPGIKGREVKGLRCLWNLLLWDLLWLIHRGRCWLLFNLRGELQSYYLLFALVPEYTCHQSGRSAVHEKA